jgi:hypothetical protein
MVDVRCGAKSLVLASLLLLCSVCSGAKEAYAGKGLIGANERTHHIQNVQMKGPEGQHLFVGYRLRTVGLILPFYAVNKGYVLGIHGSSGGGYFDMPPAPELHRLQTQGLLPNPLPSYEGSLLIDFLIGYSGWAVVAYVLLLVWREFSRSTSAPRPTAPKQRSHRRIPKGRRGHAVS